MTEIYETCREINLALLAVADFWLVYRVVVAWPAEWARPSHVGHYRSALSLLVSASVIVWLGAWWHERHNSIAGPPSLMATCWSLGIIALCWAWPKRAR